MSASIARISRSVRVDGCRLQLIDRGEERSPRYMVCMTPGGGCGLSWDFRELRDAIRQYDALKLDLAAPMGGAS